MTVKQMLKSMDSLEYAHWIAYEKVHGQIGGERYTAETLAAIHEQLQRLAYIASQAAFTSEDEPQGPVDPPQRYPRPYDNEDDVFEGTDDFSTEWLPPPEKAEECPDNCVCKVPARLPLAE